MCATVGGGTKTMAADLVLLGGAQLSYCLCQFNFVNLARLRIVKINMCVVPVYVSLDKWINNKIILN